MGDQHDAFCNEEKVDYYCRIMPCWDSRFTGCPVRQDPTVLRCRFVLRPLGLEPRFCMILRHSGPVTLRRIGEHISTTIKPFIGAPHETAEAQTAQ